MPHAKLLQASPLTSVGDGEAFASASSSRCGRRFDAACDVASSLACHFVVSGMLVGDGGLVVAETPLGCGSDPAYSLVVRRPLGVVAVHSRGFSASSIAHVRLHCHATSYSGDGQKLLEIEESCSSKPQEVRHARFDEINELSRKTDVRLDSNSKCIFNNGV